MCICLKWLVAAAFGKKRAYHKIGTSAILFCFKRLFPLPAWLLTKRIFVTSIKKFFIYYAYAFHIHWASERSRPSRLNGRVSICMCVWRAIVLATRINCFTSYGPSRAARTLASFPDLLPPQHALRNKLNAGVEKRREKAWSVFTHDTQEAHDFCDVI